MELMKDRLMTIGPLIHFGEGPEDILKHYTSAYKKAEKKKSKGRSKKRKYNGKSKKKKKRSKKTTGETNGDSTGSDSLREQLPGGDVSQREHAPELSAEQLPAQYSIKELLKFFNVYEETGQLPIDTRKWYMYADRTPLRAMTISLILSTIMSSDERQPCKIRKYQIHNSEEGLTPESEYSDFKLYMTDIPTGWTGEVIDFMGCLDNEARRFANILRGCQCLTFKAAEELALQRGDIVEVRVHQDHGYTTSILTRNDYREPIEWKEESLDEFMQIAEEITDYIEVDFNDANSFRSKNYGYG